MRQDVDGLRKRWLATAVAAHLQARRRLSPWSPPSFALIAVATALAGQFLFAQRAGIDAAPAGHLWISATPLDDHRQLLLVIDPQLRNAAVYHVDGPTGALTLKSTRNITWDLMVGDFNAQEPKPSALQKMLETGRETGPIGQNRP